LPCWRLSSGITVSSVSALDNGTGRDSDAMAADTGAGRDPPDLTRLRRLASEQAALRRVATLVASGAQPTEVFTDVADELGRLISAEATFVARIDPVTRERAEPDRYITVVGSYGRVGDQVPVGFRIKLDPGMVTTAVFQTGRPARINGERLATDPMGAMCARLGMRAAVATPIVVSGRNWGVTVAATSRKDFPAGTESRMAQFVELAATAIANAQAEQKLRELADTQASLRRLAMLIAQGAPPEAVFAAVTKEVLRHFGSGTARMIRYELDGTATLVANEGAMGPHVQVGERWEGYPATGLTATVLHTGRAARVDDYHDIPGGEPYLREGLRSAVAMPIHVNGRLWGMVAVGSGQGPLPPDTEQRITEFTDLVATAIANAQARAELSVLAEQQAALRRVATLVARGVAPSEVFSAVATELAHCLGVQNAAMYRYESDDTATLLASRDDRVLRKMKIPIGTRFSFQGDNINAMVYRTGRAARMAPATASSLPAITPILF